MSSIKKVLIVSFFRGEIRNFIKKSVMENSNLKNDKTKISELLVKL